MYPCIHPLWSPFWTSHHKYLDATTLIQQASHNINFDWDKVGASSYKDMAFGNPLDHPAISQTPWELGLSDVHTDRYQGSPNNQELQLFNRHHDHWSEMPWSYLKLDSTPSPPLVPLSLFDKTATTLLPDFSSKSSTDVPSCPSTRDTTTPTRARSKRKSSKPHLRAQYSCDFCPVQMTRLHDINRHMRLHTNEKPYECLGCGQTFRRTDARARHWAKDELCSNAHTIREPVGTKLRQRISSRLPLKQEFLFPDSSPCNDSPTL